MTLSRKTVVFGTSVCLVVLATLFCRSRFQHSGELHNYALPMSDDSVEEHMLSRENRPSFTVTNVQSSNSTNWLLAATDPQQDVFRNEMTFRNSQEKLNHRHAPSERAYNRGGCKSMLTLKILDDEGNPISGVPIHVHPMLNWKHLNSFSSCTDKNGIACLKHSDANSYVISITKVGYYDIYGTIQFFSHHYVCVDGDKWIPWNPQIEMILKKRRLGVMLNSFKSWETLPRVCPTNTDIPFDFIACDFLPPFGSGIMTNAFFNIVQLREPDVENGSVTKLTFVNGGGIRKETVNGFSRYIFPHAIAEGDFHQDVTLIKRYAKKTGGHISGGLRPDVEYFSIKIPIQFDNGRKDYCYGIILDGPIGEFRNVSANSAQLFMECYVNPEPGNRVIESEVLLRK